jgi:hypothetical protein
MAFAWFHPSVVDAVDALQNAVSVTGDGFVNHQPGDRSDAGPIRLDYFSSPVDFALVGPKCGVDDRYLAGMDGGLPGESLGNCAPGRVLRPDIVADIEERRIDHGNRDGGRASQKNVARLC